MASLGFGDSINFQLQPDAVLDISHRQKILVISDLHMGRGRSDDLQLNGDLLCRMLEDYYFKNGWHLVLNGDIEELAKHNLREIRAEWSRLYRIFDLFHNKKRLFKMLGNHDEYLIFERDYPYPLYNTLCIENNCLPVYVFHGHQASKIYTRHNNMMHNFIKYLLKPLGIRNISSARSPYRRYDVERKAYNLSLKNNCISIIGHTHRALFESLGRFDYIKFEIERLCRDYPAASVEEKKRIAFEAENLRFELSKLKRSERRDVLRQSLYGDEFPVPCLFNSGSAIGKKGITAIELDSESIALVYWFAEGRGMKFVNRGLHNFESIDNYHKTTLNKEKLEHIKAKIQLLGKKSY